MNSEAKIQELEAKIDELATRRRSGWRSRWAAIGAAVAVTLGGGTALHYASAAPGDVVTNSFVPISPTRVLDTRPAPENVGGFVGPLSSGQTHTFTVTGVAGVPVNASAVVMNVTVSATNASSFLTVYPAGAARPTASNLNWAAGDTIPNLVTVKIGTAGQVSVFNLSGNAHVIADIAGYYVPGNDKWVALDVFSTNGTATVTDGFGANTGLNFPDAASEDAGFNFVLPPDYTPGGQIAVTLNWHTGGTSCVVAWRGNSVSVVSPGQPFNVGAGASTGINGLGNATSAATANTSNATTFALVSPNGTSTLRPGDTYNFSIFRSGALGADTCATTALIHSVIVRYE